jgi:hypothetical protein
MRISGHRSRSVFDRYNIVSESDLVTALERREQYHAGQTARKVVSIRR